MRCISQNINLIPGRIFKEFLYTEVITPFKGVSDIKDSFFADLDIDDLENAIDAEIALKFWGGHMGKPVGSDFKNNQLDSKKKPGLINNKLKLLKLKE